VAGHASDPARLRLGRPARKIGTQAHRASAGPAGPEAETPHWGRILPWPEIAISVPHFRLLRLRPSSINCVPRWMRPRWMRPRWQHDHTELTAQSDPANRWCHGRVLPRSQALIHVNSSLSTWNSQV